MKKIIKLIFIDPIVYVLSQLVYYILTKLKLLNFYPKPNGGVIDVIGHNSILESADYFKPYLNNLLLFNTKEDLWDYVIMKIGKKENVLEFGVFNGESINYMSSKRPDLNFYGFDSFEGLQEDWGGSQFTKAHFDLGGNLPKVNSNVKLIKGWFNKSIPNFIKRFDKKISLLNIDCDTYESTKEVLTLLDEYIGSGTIIIFDEYFGYPGWKFGEYKAFQEFIEKRKITYRYLGIANEQQCCIILK